MITETASAAIEGITRPIAEDLSVEAVAQRLLAVLNGQVEGEDYGVNTIASTLIVLSTQAFPA